MRVTVTHDFSAVASESDVHGTHWPVGATVTGYPAEVALRNGWGTPASAPELPAGGEAILPPPTEGSELPQPPAAGPDGSEDASTDTGLPYRARLTKAYKGPGANGELVGLARNLIVDGDFARRLVADGVAIELDAAGGAPETK